MERSRACACLYAKLALLVHVQCSLSGTDASFSSTQRCMQSAPPSLRPLRHVHSMYTVLRQAGSRLVCSSDRARTRSASSSIHPSPAPRRECSAAKTYNTTKRSTPCVLRCLGVSGASTASTTRLVQTQAHFLRPASQTSVYQPVTSLVRT
eukprot:6208851-Pleurochrysis_carterae.AAC.3